MTYEHPIEEKTPFWRKALRHVVGFCCGFAWFGAVVVGGFKNVYGGSPVLGFICLVSAGYLAVATAKIWGDKLRIVFMYPAIGALISVISGPDRFGPASQVSRSDAAQLLAILVVSAALTGLITLRGRLDVWPRVCLTASAMAFAHSFWLVSMTNPKGVTADWYVIPGTDYNFEPRRTAVQSPLAPPAKLKPAPHQRRRK
jgi:hypothetical protein